MPDSKPKSKTDLTPDPNSLIKVEAVLLAVIPIFAYGLALIYEARFASVWGIPMGWVRVNPSAMIIPIYAILILSVVFWAWLVGSLAGAARSKWKKVRIVCMVLSPAVPIAFVAFLFLLLGYVAWSIVALVVALSGLVAVIWKGDPQEWEDDEDEDILNSKMILLLLLPIDALKGLGVPRPRVCVAVLLIAAIAMILAGEYAAKNAYQRHVIQIAGTDYLVLRSYQDGMIVAPFDESSGLVTAREVRLLQADQVVNQPVRLVRLRRSPLR